MQTANFQTAFCAQVTSSAKKSEKHSETENFNDQSTHFQKVFDLIKQIEETNERYRSNSSELCDTEIHTKFFMDITLPISQVQK